MKKVSLCTECHCCPAVELTPDKVRIGEEGNLVELSREEWDTLVEKIRTGELKAL